MRVKKKILITQNAQNMHTEHHRPRKYTPLPTQITNKRKNHARKRIFRGAMGNKIKRKEEKGAKSQKGETDRGGICRRALQYAAKRNDPHQETPQKPGVGTTAAKQRLWGPAINQAKKGRSRTTKMHMLCETVGKRNATSLRKIQIAFAQQKLPGKLRRSRKIATCYCAPMHAIFPN